MEDVSSGGIAFTCAADQARFQQGQRLTVRFSLPQLDGENPEAKIVDGANKVALTAV